MYAAVLIAYVYTRSLKVHSLLDTLECDMDIDMALGSARAEIV